MLIADVPYNTVLADSSSINVLDTEDLIMESCLVRDIGILEEKGIIITNAIKRKKGLFLADHTHRLTPVETINIIVGGIQIIKLNRRLLYVFFEDTSYIELRVNAGNSTLYLNDRDVGFSDALGLPFIKNGILYVSHYNRFDVRSSIALDRCQAIKNGINKKRQVLLQAR